MRMELTPWLLLTHITGAALFVGGDIILNLVAFRAWRSGDALELLRTARAMTLGISAGAVLTLLGGIGLVLTNEAWSFTTGFVLVGLAAILVSGTAESVYFRRRTEVLAGLVDTQPSSPEIRANLARLTLGAAAVNVLFVLTIWAMITKPGI